MAAFRMTPVNFRSVKVQYLLLKILEAYSLWQNTTAQDTQSRTTDPDARWGWDLSDSS